MIPDFIRVQREDFDAGRELAALTVENAGGIASFIGVVRKDQGDEPSIRAMELEHYPGMTERALAAIASEAGTRWPILHVRIIHRYGRLVPGDRIVFVGACAAHRAPAQEACAFMVDWLKTRAPFWKCEETEAGRRWVAALAKDDEAAHRWRKDA